LKYNTLFVDKTVSTQLNFH